MFGPVSIVALLTTLSHANVLFRVIDVGSEWRTFSSEKANADPSRVGGAENTLLNGTDLSTMIGPGTGSASFDEHGVAKYANRRTVSVPKTDHVVVAFPTFVANEV